MDPRRRRPDSAVANLVERGLITEAGRDDGVGGAIRYRDDADVRARLRAGEPVAAPRLDDLAGDVDELRERLHAVAEQRRPSRRDTSRDCP